MFIAIGSVGALLTLLAVRNILAAARQRQGTEPHCRRCNYLLRGLESDRCPECGSELTAANVARGSARPWWRALRPGAVIMFVVGMAMLAMWLGMAQNFNWYHYKPTFLVLRDLNSPKATDAQRAWAELVARDSAGSLWKSSRD